LRFFGLVRWGYNPALRDCRQGSNKMHNASTPVELDAAFSAIAVHNTPTLC
jgi:hypothetical protein